MRVIRLTSVLVLVLLVPLSAAAQTRGTLQLGVTAYTLQGDTESEFDPITRFSAGLGFGFELRGGITIQPEFQYVVRGGKALGSIEGVPVHATFDLTYLEFPVLALYRFETRRLVPFVFVGPSVSFQIDARVRFRAVSGGPEQEETDDTVRDRDMGITAGAGLEIPFAGEKLSVGIRTYFGITNARKSDPPLRNAGGLLFVGIIF